MQAVQGDQPNPEGQQGGLVVPPAVQWRQVLELPFLLSAVEVKGRATAPGLLNQGRMQQQSIAQVIVRPMGGQEQVLSACLVLHWQV